MQCAVIEFGRNVLGYADANSTEMNADTTAPGDRHDGGAEAISRTRAAPCVWEPIRARWSEGSLARSVYKKKDITERHRHRYEFNNTYLDAYKKGGHGGTGINPQSKLVEIVELKDHPWFIGVQFHPEYRSTVAKPHPLFVHFVRGRHEAEGGTPCRKPRKRACGACAHVSI
jgi:CTP synthase